MLKFQLLFIRQCASGSQKRDFSNRRLENLKTNRSLFSSQGKAQWVKYAVMNHFVSLVLAVISVIALSIFYSLATLLLFGAIVVGTNFVYVFTSNKLQEINRTQLEKIKSTLQ
jgi:hypothetical protein